MAASIPDEKRHGSQNIFIICQQHSRLSFGPVAPSVSDGASLFKKDVRTQQIDKSGPDPLNKNPAYYLVLTNQRSLNWSRD